MKVHDKTRLNQYIEDVVESVENLQLGLNKAALIGLANTGDHKTSQEYAEFFDELPDSLKSSVKYRHSTDSENQHRVRIKFDYISPETQITQRPLETRKRKIRKLQTELEQYFQSASVTGEQYLPKITEETDSEIVVEAQLEPNPINFSQSYLVHCDELYIDEQENTLRYVFNDADVPKTTARIRDDDELIYNTPDWVFMCPTCNANRVWYEKVAHSTTNTNNVSIFHCHNCSELTVVHVSDIRTEIVAHYDSMSDATQSLVSDLQQGQKNLPNATVITEGPPDISQPHTYTYSTTSNGITYHICAEETDEGSDSYLSWTDDKTRFTTPIELEIDSITTEITSPENIFCSLCGLPKLTTKSFRVGMQQEFTFDGEVYSTHKDAKMCPDCHKTLTTAKNKIIEENATQIFADLI